MECIGILLAGGTGTRLMPLTTGFSKHLLAVYDKPMIYYSLSSFFLAGIRNIYIVCCPRDLPFYSALLGDGSRFGVSITYVPQPLAAGIPDGLKLVGKLTKADKVMLSLGDNLFFGSKFGALLRDKSIFDSGAHIFTLKMNDVSRFGVLEISDDGAPVEILEKPLRSNSNLAIPGLYILDGASFEIASRLTPSERGELEIVDVLREYMRRKTLTYTNLGRGVAWFDMGTPDALVEASQFVKLIENRLGTKIACLEEISYHNGWISQHVLKQYLSDKPKSLYYDHLRHVLI